MKNKKLITVTIILVLVISIFGVSFALYNYNKISKNSKLIVGDIYMHYKESDTSILTTAEDTSNFYYEKDILNPNMKNQEYQELDTRNELSKCVDYFVATNLPKEQSLPFCKGETISMNSNEFNLQTMIDNKEINSTWLSNLKKINVITSDNKVNPIMATQEYQELDTQDTRNELSKCVDYISSTSIPLNDDDTYISYCQGTGKTNQGKTFQENLNEGNWFSDNILINLKNLNVVLSKQGISSSYSTDKATPNPDMKNQKYEIDNRNELSKCVDYFRELVNNSSSVPEVQSFIPNNKSNVFQMTTGILKIDNSSSAEDATIIAYCQGTGTINGNTFQSAIDNHNLNSNTLNELKDKNIVTSDNKVNPIMASQTYTENGQNELSRCVDYMMIRGGLVEPRSYNQNNYLVRQIVTSNTELTTRMINFCQGSGTFTGTEDSFNFQTAINDNYFSSDTYLYNNNIIVYETKTLPYFEFTIDGKNTSNKNINYNIKLAHGDVIENKTENNRLMDKYLIFKLVEVINNEEVELVDNIKYDNINNNIIYKNIISKNTNEEINHTYRLYMIVDPNLMIGNLEGAVYSFEEYANLFASIKVNVDGNYE